MGSEVNAIDLSTLKLGEFFVENEPFYLSIGLTHEEYWYGEPSLAKSTLRAFNLRQKREIEQGNMLAWLTGQYVQSAVTNVVGMIFAKKGLTPNDIYPESPLKLSWNDGEDKPRQSDKEVQKEQQKSLDWLLELSRRLDKEFN